MKLRFATILFVSLIVASLGSRAAADNPPTIYTVSLPAPQTQMVDIGIEVAGVTGETIDFVMPVWRPGRYVILDPASTVREVSATDHAGAPLPFEKVNKATWRVTTNGASTVKFKYRLYANALAERTRHVDDTHAFLSGSAVFMMVEGRRENAVHVKIDAPAGWKIACGLNTLPGHPRTLIAPNYDVLVDSPIEIGVHDVLEFTAAGRPHQIVIWGEVEYDAGELKRDFAKIVETETAIFGGTPYERYVFILHIGAGGGGGTEHLNSTVIQGARKSLEQRDSYKSFHSLIAHEMFHTWNVKQFRPSGLHPYDYHRENYTKLLWVAEGTTSYYDDFVPVRAGLAKPEDYLRAVSTVIDLMRNKPGELVQSLEESSYDAWIQFAKSWPDSVNSTVNFYSKGAMVSFLLDMTMRQRTGNQKCLDDVMKALYERFPLDGPGYTPDDLRAIIEELTGSDFKEFFANYIASAQPLPLEEVVGVVGLELVFDPARSDDDDDDEPASKPTKDAPADESDGSNGLGGVALDDGDGNEDDEEPIAAKPIKQKAYLGMNVNDTGGRAVVSNVLSDGPAYAAGIAAGDEVVAINGRKLTAGDLTERLKQFEPGDSIEVTLFRHDQLRVVKLTLAGKPDGKWTLRRVKKPTDDQKAAWQSWLGQPWPE